MPPPPREADEASRRGFLRLVAATAAGLTVVGGCSRSDGDPSDNASQTDGDDRKSAARPPIPDVEPTVRVRVVRSRDGAPLTIGLDQQWLRLTRGDGDVADAVVRAPITLAAGAGGWTLTDAQRYRPDIEGLERLTFAPMKQDQDIAVDETRYAGSITVVPLTEVGARAFDVVNHVAMERYLPGVLAGELYSSWDPEAFAAQAIAARSFAAVEHAYFKDRRHYDVTNTASSQVYRGQTGHDKSTDAVSRTRGQLLAYEGRLVSGYYSSCCGGLAASAVDAIGRNAINDTLPLRGRSSPDVCTEAPVYRWSVERQLPDTMRRVRGFAEDRGLRPLEEIGRIASIDVKQTNAHGRPTEYAIAGDDGASVDLGAERLRQAINFSGDSIAAPKKALWSSFVEVKIASNVVTFDGRGFGHGVGLCQYGAQTLATRGIAHRDIIDWYYPGVLVKRGYGSASPP